MSGDPSKSTPSQDPTLQAGHGQHEYYPPPPGPPSYAAQQQQQQQPYYPPPPGATNQQQQQQPYFAPPPGAPIQQQHVQHPPPPSEEQISSKKSSWGKRFDDILVKAGKPINKLTNKLGSEAFWPGTLADECDKAARILKSFTLRKDDIQNVPSNAAPPAQPNTASGPAKQSKALVKIPPKVIQNAHGLAIFTTFRTGLHISGAGGSGVVIARLANGDWSPPSAFLVHTLGYGLMAGADIYDCVCVLNTADAVAAFTHPRLSLGGEVGVTAGPVGAGSSVEGAVGKSAKPVYSYIKSRGLYGGLQVDGTVILQRPDANAEFYRTQVGVKQILAGEVQWPPTALQLREVAVDAEGKAANQGMVRGVPGETPSDVSPDVSQKELHA